MAANSAVNVPKEQTETDKQTLLAVLQFLKKQNLKVNNTRMLFLLLFSSNLVRTRGILYCFYVGEEWTGN